MSRLGKALVFIFLLILVASVALDQWRVNRWKWGSAPTDAVETSHGATSSTTSTALPTAIETEKNRIDLNCESYQYSTCPEGCNPVCTASVCSGDLCTADCDGPGSCKTKL